MKINIYNSPDSDFKSIPIGECFMFDGNLYMVIQKCRHETEDWKYYNAIRLATGECTEFAETCYVCPVSAQVNIE